MARVYGREFSKYELLRRAGDISQLAGARKCILEDGKAGGVHAVDIRTGTGLNLTVLPDRGLDIAWADYKGMALGYISKTGVVSPSYYEPEGTGFLRGFYGGLLTTCGLTHMGAACVDDGISLGLHGRASNLPAEDVCVTNEWEGDEFVMKIRGRTRESRVFGENLTLTRQITARLGDNRIWIHDAVENCGFERQPLMLLYHFNFGYPLLDEGTELFLPEGKIRPRDADAAQGLKDSMKFTGPAHGFAEQVFYHSFYETAGESVVARLQNKALGPCGLGVYLKYNPRQLPCFIEWKQTGEGEYVLGLEPATWYTEGRKTARQNKELDFIEAGEVRHFEFQFGVGTINELLFLESS